MYKIYVTRNIDTGHRVVGHEGKCQYLHGHTYEVEVTLLAYDLVEPGFVVDFGIVKRMIDAWDHRLLLWDEDPFFQEIGQKRHLPDVMHEFGFVNVPFNPTAENMSKFLCERFYHDFDNVIGCTVIVSETESTEATYKLP